MKKKINNIMSIEAESYLAMDIDIKKYNLILNESNFSEQYANFKKAIAESIGSIILNNISKKTKKGDSFLFKLYVK